MRHGASHAVNNMRIFGFEIRRVNDKEFTALHPDFKTLVEYAFTVNGVEYFEFKTLLDMPTLRYKKVMELIREAEMSLKSVDLVKYLEKSISFLEKGELAKSIVIQNSISALASQFMETDTYYRLFSAVFFTLDEDISDYDYDYNEQKIELFKKEKIDDFFFREPMKRYLPQTNISPKDLEVFSKLTNVNKEMLQRYD